MIDKVRKLIEEKFSIENKIYNKLNNKSGDKLVIEGPNRNINIRIFIDESYLIFCKAYLLNSRIFTLQNKELFKPNILGITSIGGLMIKFDSIKSFSIFLEKVNEEVNSNEWQVFEYDKELDMYINIK